MASSNRDLHWSKIYSHVEASTSRGGNSGEDLDVDKKEKRSSDIDMDVSCNPRSWRNRFVYFQWRFP